MKRRTPRGEGRVADKVRGHLEARGYAVEFFWFQVPSPNRHGAGAKWGAYGSDGDGRQMSFFSFDTMSEVARMKRPAMDSNYSDSTAILEIFATEEN